MNCTEQNTRMIANFDIWKQGIRRLIESSESPALSGYGCMTYRLEMRSILMNILPALNFGVGLLDIAFNAAVSTFILTRKKLYKTVYWSIVHRKFLVLVLFCSPVKLIGAFAELEFSACHFGHVRFENS